MTYSHLKLRYARFSFLTYAENSNLRIWAVVRLCGRWAVTILLLPAELIGNPVVSSQSLYIATLVGRLCCTRLLILLQREPTKPLYNGSWSTWGLSFSKSLIIFVWCIKWFTYPVIRCISLLTEKMLCLPMGKFVCLVEGCCCPSLLYNIDKKVGQSFWL